MESKAVNISELIRQSNILYKNDLIANRKEIYGVGDTIELFFAKGDYVANLNKSKLYYRDVIKTDQPNSCTQPNDNKAYFQIQYIQWDGRDLLAVQGERSRPIINAFRERLSDADKCKNDPLGQHNRDRYCDYIIPGGDDADNNPSQNTHFITGVPKFIGNAAGTNVQSQSYHGGDFDNKTYKKVYERGIFEAQKRGHFIMNTIYTVGSTYVSDQDSDIATTTANYQQNKEGQTFKCVSLGDLSMEMATMNQVYMGNFTDGIRISLRLLEPRYCLHCVIPESSRSNTQHINIDTQFALTALTTYKLTDLYMSLREHKLNPEGAIIMRDLSQKLPQPYITYQYQMKSLDGPQTTLVDTTTLNFRNYLGTIIIFTGQGPQIGQLMNNLVTSAVVGDGRGVKKTVDYRGPFIHNQPVNQYNSDHFFLPYVKAQVEVNNNIYKQNTPPIPNRVFASYLQSIDAIDIMFNGKVYDVDFEEFLDRAHAICIPTNSMGVSGIDVKGQRLTTQMEFGGFQNGGVQYYTGRPNHLANNVAGGNSSDFLGKTISNYQCHIYHFGVASVRFDPQAGILVE